MPRASSFVTGAVLILLFIAGVSCVAGVSDGPASVSPATSAVASAAPALSPVAPLDDGKRGGVLRVAQARDPASCDLHSSRALSYQAVHPCNPMLSQLVRAAASDHSSIEPDLAQSWSVGPDGVRWTFQLRTDVLWHDGTPLTPDDVVFSLRRIIEPPAGIAIGRAGAIARYISRPDQIQADGNDIVITTDFPAASFLPNLASAYVSIYPRRATEALDPPTMTSFMSVVGTGPFKGGPVTRGSRYVLDRNDDYYIPQLPYLDRVEFLVMPEPAVRMAAMRAHEIDVIAIITEAEARSLESAFAGRITVHRTPSAGGNTVQMNLRAAPFDDPRVRRAVNLSISREDANRVLGPGFAGAVLPPGGPLALSQSAVLALPGYGDVDANRAAARVLLDEAGFPDGFKTTIHTRANPFFQTLSDFVAGQLATIGIQAKVVPVEAVSYQEMIMAGEFEMIGHSHSFSLDDPDAVLPSHYSCGGAENYPGLCDPALDELIARQSRELDPEKRRTLLNEIERLVWNADAKVWFQWSARRTPVWNTVKGLEPGGPSLYQGRRLDEVYIVEAGE